MLKMTTSRTAVNDVQALELGDHICAQGASVLDEWPIECSYSCAST